ncbi:MULTISPECIES: spermidine/putrescine ABC transporter ATP-binding protein PotA [unclassified Pseudodesulfovibrio]|uniref:spermidine/putrescine ABC transporter ATP-binding protein PotA n=1 Tax=unclassified Pseudodesulfovibrio TaxID=2661612 RepID=UPI000FEB88B7|nr:MULTISPECIES: spermidine/putrescine ABC transporter ATP-binding protein PotA [unclassified Pseudodesulfovibrio]MCJ2164557.1 spermidine/putrescine ABC transporter ATP-binding protein PotA [Pseudodesulfovibrio sp. S3-i]RWU04755.1 spermidine/putrescine ABC transporter ATP-binding protein PotA [Pseudodesulfovibrio sp. S3]
MKQPVIQIANAMKSFDGEIAIEDFTLSIEDGEFLTLLGPSGCGKTTILRMLGGFETCDGGEVYIDGQSVAGVPPESRAVNTVFQSYALFPHMNVFDNVAFGLRIAGMSEPKIAKTVKEALKLVRLETMMNRMPRELSGGQQQRVAIARAIVNKPRVLLLDEPLSALDYRLRKQMQKELKELQRTLGITFILVTHDQEEAFTMSDRVVVMNDGRIEQVGTPREVYEDPANLYVARFVGEINVLDGSIISREEHNYVAQVEGVEVLVKSKRDFQPGDPVHVLLRPEDFRMEVMQDIEDSPDLADKFAKALLKGKVDRTYYKGATYDVDITLDDGKRILVSEFFDEDSETLYFHPGDRVAVGWFEGWEVILPHEG